MLTFILNKFLLRPCVLQNELPEFFRIIVLSIPNLIEAVVGTLILTGILLFLKQEFSKHLGHIKNTYIYLVAVTIAAIYVLSQELKFHNIGGNNVYDIYDILASIIGLVLTFGVLQVFGFTEASSD